jgi:hypothetical protein
MMIQDATRERSPTAIAGAASSIGVDKEVVVDELLTRVSLRAPARHVVRAMELLAELILDPAFDESRFHACPAGPRDRPRSHEGRSRPRSPPVRA